MPTLRPEEIIQSNCVKWFSDTYPAWRQMLHCNNNNSHNRIKGSLNAAMGVVPGPSDLELVCSGYVLFLECKTPTGTQDQPQKDFQKKVEFLGHKYVIFRSLEQFKQIIWENIGR